MLVMVDTPSYLDSLYAQVKETGEQIYDAVMEAGDRESVAAGTDLLARSDPAYVYVHSGSFQFIDSSGQTVRYYNARDFILGGQTEQVSGSKIVCEEAGDVTTFPREPFIEALSKSPHLLRSWMDLQEMESRVMHILGSVFLHAKVAEDVKVATFEPGEVIVEEGTDADEIYLLLEGQAKVVAGGVQVGMVNAGEVFGEIAFLTHQKRTADVIADSTCLVQVADNTSFIKLARKRPQIVVEMSRALARRVVALNQKLQDLTGQPQ